MSERVDIDIPVASAPWFVAGLEHGRGESLRAAAAQLRAAAKLYEADIERRLKLVRGKAKQTKTRAEYAQFILVFEQVATTLDQAASTQGFKARAAIRAALESTNNGGPGFVTRVLESFLPPAERRRR